MGRLVEKKGFDLLLDAYAGLPATTPPLVILGEEDAGAVGGGKRNVLAQQAQALGIERRVHFMGEVNDIATWYRHAELFVLSSRQEPFGNVIIEAMAYGCPVVSFDCPDGPGEIITHNKNGLLVGAEDVPALTKAIAKLLGDAKLRGRLSLAGKTRAKDFAVAKLAPLWLK